MVRVRHRVGVCSTAPQVFRALTQPERLAGWWPTQARGSARSGGRLELVFGGVVTLTFEVRATEPNRRLQLVCHDGPGPWSGSRLSFSLEESEGQVFVTLIHESTDATEEDFLYFNTKWPLYLLSLRDYLESGKGRPSPRDIPIFVGDSVLSNTTGSETAS